jgi:DnaJ-class molecular chaperone
MAFLRFLLLALLALLIIRLLWRVLRDLNVARLSRQQRGELADEGEPRTPYEVLGVEPTASADEIRRAYQRLIQQYHPDRLDTMAPELRALAERRTKQLNAAYEALQGPRRR